MIYEGERTLEGTLVTVDGKPLPPRLDLRGYSKTGFEWGYAGPAPRQLALALVANHTETVGWPSSRVPGSCTAWSSTWTTNGG